MSQAITIKGRVSAILLDPHLSQTLVHRLRQSRFIVMKKYFKEAPVDKGDLRNKIRDKKITGGYSVSTIAHNRGKPYPIYVHEGTGIFKGVEADFPSTGRVRSGESKMNRGSGGIRPNKFAKRASEKSMPLILNYMSEVIDDLSLSLIEI